MGTCGTTIGGLSTFGNITRPSVIHFHKYLKINKELSDVLTYSTTGPSSTGTVVTSSQL